MVMSLIIYNVSSIIIWSPLKLVAEKFSLMKFSLQLYNNVSQKFDYIYGGLNLSFLRYGRSALTL